MLTPDVILAIDDIRQSLAGVYDPIRGKGSYGHRKRCRTPVPGLTTALIPDSMTADPMYAKVRNDAVAWRKLRCRHDFEYWCAECVRIQGKGMGRIVPFVLNRPQRRVMAVMEDDRVAGRPIRLILLKARQWGGSTLVQMYMVWIQCCHRQSWNSLICAHQKDTAAAIRGMYSRVLQSYPAELWEGESAPQFKPYEQSSNIRRIEGRECCVTLASSERPDAVRGGDYAMAHLSEMAFWADSPSRQPADLIRAVCAGVPLAPYTLIAVESTANGVGNYFHSEWLRCRGGEGDKHAVFVPWFEIEAYRLRPPDAEAFAASLTEAEKAMWRMGVTLDCLCWRRHKRSEYQSEIQMQAEYPFDDTEAFASTGAGVFDAADIAMLRQECTEPVFCGEIDVDGVHAGAGGNLRIWQQPRADVRYVVGVDIGGRSAESDWSVASVVAFEPGHRPEVAAQWRGHVEHNVLVDRITALGRYYRNALLVVESNTFESRDGGVEDAGLFIISRLAHSYTNLYRRRSYDTATGAPTTRIGFHTNRATKPMLIIHLQGLVKECAYVERDGGACDELATYELSPSGVYAAQRGFHDDILMSRAIALFVGASSGPVAMGGDHGPVGTGW